MYRNPRIARLTPAYLAEAYLGQGQTGTEIARALDVSQAEVYRALAAAGIPRRGRGPRAGPGAQRRGQAPADPADTRLTAKLRMRRLRLRQGVRPRPGPRRDTIPADQKWCPRCGQVQPRTAFRAQGGKHPRRHSWCRPCERAWHRAHAAALRQSEKGASDGHV